MMLSSLTLWMALAAGADGHLQANPVYRELRETGVLADRDALGRLAEPTMADGLDQVAQRSTLQQLAGPDASLDRLQRSSIVAPHILRMDQQTVPGQEAVLRRADFWFIAYGKLETLANEAFLGELLSLSEETATGTTISDDELTKRGIRRAHESNREGFGHATYALMNRVELRLTGHSYWSQTDDSLLTAVILDPRFARDAQYPNTWRALKAGDTGQVVAGDPQPYGGCGFYLKITRLAAPPNALLAEGHLAFVEPRGWFSGANALASKLPVIVQAQVRNSRRAMLKAMQTAPGK